MKGKNGLKILKLFDYFKMAYKLNTDNKGLYKPQIIYLVLRGTLIFLTGMSFVSIAQSLVPFVGTISFSKFFLLFWSEFKGTPLLLIISTILVALFGSTYVEAGLYTKYAKLNQGLEDDQVFTAGANRYFFSFLLGNILIALFWIVMSIPYLIVGALTLTLGLVWIPIIVSSLLMVWKAAIVTDDLHTMTAISKSIDFAKRHFLPANVFIIIQLALTSRSSSSAGSGNTSNFTNSFNESTPGISEMPFQTPSGPSFDSFFNQSFISTGIGIAAALISIISILSGMISMLFEIFFGLATVIIYQDDWTIEAVDSQTETLEPLEVEL